MLNNRFFPCYISNRIQVNIEKHPSPGWFGRGELSSIPRIERYSENTGKSAPHSTSLLGCVWPEQPESDDETLFVQVIASLIFQHLSPQGVLTWGYA